MEGLLSTQDECNLRPSSFITDILPKLVLKSERFIPPQYNHFHPIYFKKEQCLFSKNCFINTFIKKTRGNRLVFLYPFFSSLPAPLSFLYHFSMEKEEIPVIHKKFNSCVLFCFFNSIKNSFRKQVKHFFPPTKNSSFSKTKFKKKTSNQLPLLSINLALSTIRAPHLKSF